MSTAPPFVFPTDLNSLEDFPTDHRLYVAAPVSVASLEPSELDHLIKGLAFDLSDKELFCVEEQDVFDRVYSFVKCFQVLNDSSKFNLVESLRSNLSVLIPNVDSILRAPQDSGVDVATRIASCRNALKIYTYFLLNLVITEEGKDAAVTSKAAPQTRKKNPTNSWNWETQRSRIVTLIANSLEINLSLLFGSDDIDQNYLSFISKCSLTLYENPTILKDGSTRDSLGRIIGTIATKYRQTDQICGSVLRLIHKFDFAVPHIAEAVSEAEKKYSDGSLAIALIRDIARTDPKDYVRDAVGAENVGRFLVELSDRSPKLVSTNVGVLVPHFGGDSYKIRNALVGVLGKLVSKAFKDVEGDASSKALRLRGKQAMLEILIERCRDVTAYTRSRVLQVWADLCEEHALSIGLWNEVAEVAKGRLEDKSANVRKSALNLLITMLQHNPFGPQLKVAAFEATLENYKKKLNEMEPTKISEDDEHESEIITESVSDSCLPSSQEEESTVPDIGNLEQVRALVASLEAGLRFAKCITSTMSVLVQLLASSSASDVESTILLLMRCRQFQIDGSEESLRKMFPLVFSQDKSISEAVESAFINIYIRKNAAETARNLISLVTDSSIGDLAALEFLISNLVSKGEISTPMVSSLWDFFCFNISGVTATQSRGALSVLCMAAKSSPAIVSSHLQDIVDIGFGRWAKEEPLLARTACIALERLSDEDKEKIRCTGNKIFGSIQNMITGSRLPDNIWYTTADKAISTIYSIHPTPEIFARDLVKKSLGSVFGLTSNNVTNEQDEGVSNCLTVSAAKLGRFAFIISHIALNQLVYIESCVRKIRKQKAKKERVQLESDCNIDGESEATKVQNINAELGVGISEDAVIDSLSEKAEKEIVSGGLGEKSLIGQCAQVLSKVCRNFKLIEKFPGLQASAMLALCKLMIIDADFCAENLPLLFTVVEKAPSETVRSNCTISLGDLAARFPNLLEPWTENMYARLKDPSVSVRKNAVLVLSHLILNDMMKVKGYINEMAVCIEDKDERISSLAKLFFHELSKKGSNPIYNLLPDILSRLSNQNLEEDAFCNIMQFLITSIKKDKQMEALVEKLCNRFSGITDARQWENIAYCLSQLTFSDKGLKKLIDSFKIYEHALCENSVMDYFRVIINKSKKFTKPEVKSSIEEFEEKLNKIHMERKEQEETARNAQYHKEKLSSIQSLITTSNSNVENNAEVDENGEVIDENGEAIEGNDDGNEEAIDGNSDGNGEVIDGNGEAEKSSTNCEPVSNAKEVETDENGISSVINKDEQEEPAETDENGISSVINKDEQVEPAETDESGISTVINKDEQEEPEVLSPKTSRRATRTTKLRETAPRTRRQTRSTRR